jgi:L-ascorbate metabolism protein UlaG (beta-lactamase superfamily)
MIEPFATDDAFLASVEEALAVDEVRVWWLGQSGFLVRWHDRRILLDPYLSDSLTTKYRDSDKPHVRMTARVIAPERLARIDVVTSTHNHTDHLDAETLLALRRANSALQLIIPAANEAFVRERLGDAAGHPMLLDDGASVEMPGVKVHGIAAAHNEVERDEDGRCRFLGYMLDLGGSRIYHSGDTLRYPGMVERLRAFGRIDLALLPINGNKPGRRVAGNLDGREAAQLAQDIGARLVVPCHYEMFEFNTADPRELFVPECERLGQKYRLLRAGEGLTLGRFPLI